MIRFVKEGRLRFHQSREPQPPFWQATTLFPYAPEIRSQPVGIDPIRLTGSSPRSVEVKVSAPFTTTELDRLPAPILIDARGPEEMIYARGAHLLHELPADNQPMLLLSTDGEVPREIIAAEPLLVLLLWPVDLIALESLIERVVDAGWPWGILIPVVFPLTTELSLLDRVSGLASRHGARFLASASIELDARAKRAVADMLPELDEETWATLFDSHLEPIHLATERHIAALAASQGMEDHIVPWDKGARNNRAAAAHLARAGIRMVRMDYDVELGWNLIKASRRIATLDKELVRLASAASIGIIPELQDEVLADVVEQWLDRGSADFTDHVDARWRVSRQAGLEPPD